MCCAACVIEDKGSPCVVERQCKARDCEVWPWHASFLTGALRSYGEGWRKFRAGDYQAAANCLQQHLRNSNDIDQCGQRLLAIAQAYATRVPQEAYRRTIGPPWEGIEEDAGYYRHGIGDCLQSSPSTVSSGGQNLECIDYQTDVGSSNDIMGMKATSSF